MRKIAIISMALVMMLSCKESMKEVSDRVFDVALSQYALLDAGLGEGQYAKTYENGELKTSGLKWWCSGFPAGTMWYIYEYTQDPDMLSLALKHTDRMADILDYPTHHDIGFQVNNSYGHAYRLTGDDAYLPLIYAAAQRLSARMNPVCGVTRSWDAEGGVYPVIIDNMMNLELLENASKLFEDPGLDIVARTHANTTMKNHFRDDYTCYHLLDYNPETGEVMVKRTVQGYADETCWSRGEAWALYGYTMMFRETGLEPYLEQAEHVAEYILSVLPEDGIPYWDFNAPGTPCALPADAKGCPEVYDWKEGEPVKRDASAAAIMASAFVDLSRLTADPAASKTYIATAEKMLRTLASPEYLCQKGDNGGFLVKHCVGNLHGGKNGPTEVDVPLTYADYYFVEALVKFNKK